MNNKNYRLLLLFVIVIFIWGVSWPAAKIGLNYMSPLWYTAARLILATITMSAIVIAIGKFSLPNKEDMPLILIIGILQISLYIWLTNLGLKYIPAGRSSLLSYTTPLWIMPITTFWLKEKSGPLRWLGFWLGVVGLLILVSPWEMEWSDGNIVFGCIMLLLSSLVWAISMLCTRYMRWSKSPLELMPWQLLFATIPTLIFAMAQESTITLAWNSDLMLSLAYTGILVTGFSYWGGLIVTKELPTTVVSIGFLTVPVFSLLISSVYMHEAISLSVGAAMGLILLGLVCVVV